MTRTPIVDPTPDSCIVYQDPLTKTLRLPLICRNITTM